MKAIVHARYGPPREVLTLEDVEEPTPGDGEVLVRVRGASVNPADWHIARGDPYTPFMRGFGAFAELASVPAGVGRVQHEERRAGPLAPGESSGRIIGPVARSVAPVVDRRHPLAEVPEAIAYLEQGHARGKVVIGV
jgi:NADPH:quinone reductase-like Zn-dependent oxidoreductase